MSVGRVLKKMYDLAVMAKAAKSVGYSTREDSIPLGWGHRSVHLSDGSNAKRCDLVIEAKAQTSNGTYDIGFRSIQGNEVELVADFHGGHVDEALKEILPAYVAEKLARGRSYSSSYNKETNKTRVEINI